MGSRLLATLIALSVVTAAFAVKSIEGQARGEFNLPAVARAAVAVSAEPEWLGHGAEGSHTPASGASVPDLGITPAASYGVPAGQPSPYCIVLAGQPTPAYGGPAGQKVLPQPDLETLPKPTPVRMPPAETPLPGVVSSTVFVDTALPAPSGVVSVDAEALLWLIPNRRPPSGLAVPDALGAASSGAFNSLGDEHLNRHMVPGARVALGYWWMSDNPWVPGGRLPMLGVETRFLFVGERSVSFTDDRSPTLVRPFFNLNTGMESGVVVATPGLATGFLSATASERIWGSEVNLWSNLHFDWPGTTCSIEGMVGVRYLELNEGIQIVRSSVFAANPVGFPDFAFLAGNRITEQESIAGQNRFVGGQVGVRANVMFDCAILTTQLQLAAGDTNERINFQGAQRRILPTGQSIVSPGALFALPSNIGNHCRDEFTLMPEIGVKLAFPINEHLTLAAGFSTLYWSRIARPGQQVDRSVDVTQIPSFPGAAAAMPTGLARPSVPFNQTDLWLMGISVSAEFKW
jgi:hypothetical protein